MIHIFAATQSQGEEYAAQNDLDPPFRVFFGQRSPRGYKYTSNDTVVFLPGAPAEIVSEARRNISLVKGDPEIYVV